MNAFLSSTLPAEVTPVSHNDLHGTVETMIKRGHPNLNKSNWKSIALQIDGGLRINRCMVYNVLDKMVKSKTAAS